MLIKTLILSVVTLVCGIDAFLPSSRLVRQASASRAVFAALDEVTQSSIASSSATSSPSSCSTFVSPMFQCYIEDTDSYGVMYNANYLRSYDRALHSMYALQDRGGILYNNNSDNNNNSGARKQSMLDTHEDWTIIHVDNQKFKTSPKLGGTYCVHGTLVEHLDDMEIWDLVMHETEDPASTIFNSARATIARPGVYATPVRILAENKNDNTFTTTKDIFRLFRDEFDTHFPTHIPLRNVLTLFERSRSNFLGGPDALRRLKDDHGLLFVVTKVNDCCKFPSSEIDGTNSIDFLLKPGQLVVVQTDFEVKRKGMIIECHHTLKARNRPVAQGTVTLMTLDAATFKPR